MLALTVTQEDETRREIRLKHTNKHTLSLPTLITVLFAKSEPEATMSMTTIPPSPAAGVDIPRHVGPHQRQRLPLHH
jgi:hypothetical protein